MLSVSITNPAQKVTDEKSTKFVENTLLKRDFKLIVHTGTYPITKRFVKGKCFINEFITNSHVFGELRSYHIQNPSSEMGEIFLEIANHFLEKGYFIKGLQQEF